MDAGDRRVQLPELLLVAAQDIQNMIQLKMNLIMAFGIASEGSGWREIPQKYNDLWEEMRRQSLNGEDSIFLQNGKESITDSFNGEETDFSSMFPPLTEKLGCWKISCLKRTSPPLNPV